MMADSHDRSVEDRENEARDDGAPDIRFLQEKRKSSRSLYFVALLLVAGALAYGLWYRSAFVPAVTDGVAVPSAQAPGVLLDRLWIDAVPQQPADRFNFYVFTSDDDLGVNDKAQSIYKHLVELFLFRAGDSEVRFQFPHDSRTLRSAYKVEKLSRPKDDLDLKLTLTADPQENGKSKIYFSSTRWNSLDRNTLPPLLRQVPLQPPAGASMPGHSPF